MEGMENQTRTTVADEQSEARHGSGEEPEPAVVNGEEQLRHIEMRFANAVPFRMGAGCVITTPIVILLSQGICPSGATGDIWVFVSLVDANSEQSVGEDVLQGQRADNAHPIRGQLCQTEGSLAYASFPDLVISKPGNFRLRITAIDTSMGHSYVLPAIVSEPIHVIETNLFSSPDISAEALLRLCVNLHA